MLKRADIPELLDDDLGTPAEIASSLADLRRVNKLFGGIATGEALLTRIAEATAADSFSVLDVGGAAGDSAAELERRLQRKGVALDFTIVDRKPTHMNGRFPSVAGDAMALPFRDGSFDVVSCALLIHHFGPEELVGFVRDALRVTRRAVVINDLRRESAHLAMVYAGMPMFRSRITRHDAPASVRRAYTPAELKEVLAAKFTNRVEITRHFFFRMGGIVWK